LNWKTRSRPAALLVNLDSILLVMSANAGLGYPDSGFCWSNVNMPLLFIL